MDQNVTFRATNFNGGSNQFRSFSERLDRKERYKKLDEMAAARDAENRRRYEIAQGRLDASTARSITAADRAEARAVGADSRAIEKHGISMDNSRMVNEQNKMKLDSMKDAEAVQDNFAQTIMGTNTEQADEVNDLYVVATQADADALAAGKVYKKDEKTEVDKLNEVIQNSFNDNKIDLNQVTDKNQYAQKVRAKLVQQGATPDQIDSMVKTATAGFEETDGTRAANLTAGNKMITDAYKDQVAENKTLEKEGDFDIEKILKTDAVKNIENPWTDAFDGFEKDKKGGWKLKGNDEEIGSGEVGKFLSDIKGMDFVVEKAKTVKGKKVAAKTKKLTESQVKEALAASYIDNGPIGGANHIDAQKFLDIATRITLRDKDKARKRSASSLKDDATRAINENAKKYAKTSGAQKVNDALQISRKKLQP